MLFIPPNCTGVLQPCDVGIQRPLKNEFRAQFEEYLSQSMLRQLGKYNGNAEGAMKSIMSKMNLKYSALKTVMVDWFVAAHKHINKHELVMSSWQPLEKAFDINVQREAVKNYSVLFSKTVAEQAADNEVDGAVPFNDEPLVVDLDGVARTAVELREKGVAPMPCDGDSDEEADDDGSESDEDGSGEGEEEEEESESEEEEESEDESDDNGADENDKGNAPAPAPAPEDKGKAKLKDIGSEFAKEYARFGDIKHYLVGNHVNAPGSLWGKRGKFMGTIKSVNSSKKQVLIYWHKEKQLGPMPITQAIKLKYFGDPKI